MDLGMAAAMNECRKKLGDGPGGKLQSHRQRTARVSSSKVVVGWMVSVLLRLAEVGTWPRLPRCRAGVGYRVRELVGQHEINNGR